jgi:hypothetical protein
MLSEMSEQKNRPVRRDLIAVPSRVIPAESEV